MAGDLKKAAKTLGLDITKVLTDPEIKNLEKMPAKKAAPMIADAFKKANKVAKADALIAALQASGFA